YYLVFILGWVRILAGFEVQVRYGVALQAEMISMLAKYIPGGVWTPAARVAALERLSGERATGTVLASILVEAAVSALSGVTVLNRLAITLVEVALFACGLVFWRLRRQAGARAAAER